MKLEVDCYSGRKADEKPVRFRLDGHEYLVEEMLDQWYGPEDVFYKVRADDGNLYILRQQASAPDQPRSHGRGRAAKHLHPPVHKMLRRSAPPEKPSSSFVCGSPVAKQSSRCHQSGPQVGHKTSHKDARYACFPV